MCYTHGSDCDVMAMDTLQVISVKVASIEEGLCWPLQVFGMVSARDVLDRKRNIIFHRGRENCQIITEKVCIYYLFSFRTINNSCVVSPDIVIISLSNKFMHIRRPCEETVINMRFRF
jgi:hypothetical protein